MGYVRYAEQYYQQAPFDWIKRVLKFYKNKKIEEENTLKPRKRQKTFVSHGTTPVGEKWARGDVNELTGENFSKIIRFYAISVFQSITITSFSFFYKNQSLSIWVEQIAIFHSTLYYMLDPSPLHIQQGVRGCLVPIHLFQRFKASNLASPIHSDRQKKEPINKKHRVKEEKNMHPIHLCLLYRLVGSQPFGITGVEEKRKYTCFPPSSTPSNMIDRGCNREFLIKSVLKSDSLSSVYLPSPRRSDT